MKAADALQDAAHAVLVPREIVNADSVFVVSWSVADGALVEAGAALCEIETSKAIETITAEHGGYVRIVATAGAEVPVGGLLAYLLSRPDAPLPAQSLTGEGAGGAPSSGMSSIQGTATSGGVRAASTMPTGAAPLSAAQTGTARAGAAQGGAAAAGTLQISAKARQKMAELGIDGAAFAGRAFVREQDVVEYARAQGKRGAHGERADSARDLRGAFTVEPLGPIQRRVARVMEQSVAAIPAACLERLVDLAPVRARARAIAQENKSVVTEVDLLVEALASACTSFPHFNAYLASDYNLHVFQQVNVGVAVDVEGDLFVVVVKNAAEKAPAAIAKELRGLQYLAQRRRLGADHLGGGTITITSMLGRGVHRFQPIPYPQQSAILGIADPPPGDTRAALTLVFDHRVANGSQAAAFLAAVAERLSA